MKPKADEEIREHAAALREASPQPKGCDCPDCRREVKAEDDSLTWDDTVEF